MNRVPADDRVAGELVVGELSGDGVRVARVSGIRKAAAVLDDGQPDLPSGGYAELLGGGQRDYLA